MSVFLTPPLPFDKLSTFLMYMCYACSPSQKSCMMVNAVNGQSLHSIVLVVESLRLVLFVYSTNTHREDKF